MYEEINLWLSHRPLEKEVRKALFSLAPSKAPDPDGFIVSFFQKFWLDLKSTVMACVREFFEGKPLLQAANHT